MATPAQQRANRANSEKSSGPKTQTGKETSSQNRASHGLAPHNSNSFYFLDDEDVQKFKALQDRLVEEYQPETDTEAILVRNMAQHDWLRARALRLQHSCVFEERHVFATAQFALYMRYYATHERAFYKALNELQKIRKEKANQQIGFEAQKLAKAAAHRAAELLEMKKVELRMKIKRANLQPKPENGPVPPVPQTETGPGDQKRAA